MAVWQALLDGLNILSGNWTVVLGATVVTCLGCSFSFFLSKGTPQENMPSWRNALVPGSFFGISLVLRLAFLEEAFLPSYFDSVEHYRIIKQLVTALDSSSFPATLPTWTSDYYHLGFHFLASFLTLGLHADPIDVILFLGQVLLAAIPIPLFFLIRYETQSDSAAFFSMLLAGFGWYMPGFAVNWGKYPALAGLLATEIVLSLAYFISRKKTGKNLLLYVGLLLSGTMLSAIFHTRTLAVLIISAVSWPVANKISKLPWVLQSIWLGFLHAGILVFGSFILKEPTLNLALDPYLGVGLWVTLAIALLSPFALLKFARGYYFSMLFLLGTLAALFIPLGIQSPAFENQTLLDRPFVEMVLYLPLSILAGLGLAGLLEAFRNASIFSKKARLYAADVLAICMVGLTGWMLTNPYEFYPSDCCNFIKYDDTIAMEWIDKNFPGNARILVAGTQLRVLPSGPAANLVGTDGGIWIPALTGRSIILAPFDTDFRSKNTLEELCRWQVGYLYLGSTSHTFNQALLSARTEWYDRLLFLPNVQLYQLTGCL